MSLYECTRFPNLCNSADIRVVPGIRQLIGLHAPGDRLYLAWAYLVKAHSGEEQEVTFFSNDGVVKVDVIEWCIRAREEFTPQASNSGNSTGVYFGEVK
jgi:hypothetical protein